MNREDALVVQCTECGARNRIPASKRDADPRCGKCKAPLEPAIQRAETGAVHTLRCAECGARNRVPAGRLEAGPRCGKCKSLLDTRDLFTREPMVVTDADFEARVIRSPLPVLMFCWAPWCGSCGMIAPTIDALAAEWTGKIRVAKLNVDENQMLATRFQIRSVPILFIFDGGRQIESIVGAVPKFEIVQKMARYL
jgi:thioredoxin 2